MPPSVTKLPPSTTGQPGNCDATADRSGIARMRPESPRPSWKGERRVYWSTRRRRHQHLATPARIGGRRRDEHGLERRSCDGSLPVPSAVVIPGPRGWTVPSAPILLRDRYRGSAGWLYSVHSRALVVQAGGPPRLGGDRSSAMELWLHAFSFPGRVAELAQRAEQWGFAGLLVADSQNLTGDIWVELALAGAATSRLRLGPGVTNAVTRHIAVTASAAATLQTETRGRVTLGFAQGDSALSQIGCTRLSVMEFEHALKMLQGFLRGDQVTLENGTTSAIRWLHGSDLPKVPVHVAATGPRTIQAAAQDAEGVDLTVGAELERLRRGVATARHAGPPSLTVGAYLNVLLAQGLSEAFADKPEVVILRKARENSGLVRDDYFDWVKAAHDLVAGPDKIDVAVMMIGSNDRQQIRDGAGTADLQTPRWKELYAARVEAIADLFRDKKIPLIWVGLPIMKSERLSADMAEFNEIYRDKRRQGGCDLYRHLGSLRRRSRPIFGLWPRCQRPVRQDQGGRRRSLHPGGSPHAGAFRRRRHPPRRATGAAAARSGRRGARAARCGRAATGSDVATAGPRRTRRPAGPGAAAGGRHPGQAGGRTRRPAQCAGGLARRSSGDAGERRGFDQRRSGAARQGARRRPSARRTARPHR